MKSFLAGQFPDSCKVIEYFNVITTYSKYFLNNKTVSRATSKVSSFVEFVFLFVLCIYYLKVIDVGGNIRKQYLDIKNKNSCQRNTNKPMANKIDTSI